MLLSPVVSLQKLVLMLMVDEGTRTFGEKSGIVTKFDSLLVTTMTCIFFIRAFIPSLRLSNKVLDALASSSNYMNISKNGSEQRPIETKRVSSQSLKPNETSGIILQEFYIKCIKPFGAGIIFLNFSTPCR